MRQISRSPWFLSLLVGASFGTACGGGTDTPADDQDQDGFSVPADCNDLEYATNPAASELCDGKDNNCNGQADEGFTLTAYYADADGDGVGSNTASTQACTQPAGYTTASGDCDDANAAIKPGAYETTCNGIDENCSADRDDHPDLDADGVDICPPGVAGADGYAVDCNDASSAISPNAFEQCNKLDDNCNAQIDEGLPTNTYYQDADLDTFGSDTVTIQDCSAPAGYTTVAGDCDDSNNAVNPNSLENIGDGVDSNCNGYSDAIVTLGGNGSAGYAGDGGDISLARFSSPGGITIDMQGNVYLADTANHRVRKITVDGIITTFAGNGTAGYLGDNGQAANAQLSSPASVSADGAGNLYIADTGNHKIRSVAPNGIIRTIFGNGTPGSSGDGGNGSNAQLNSPEGVTADPAGNLYISDTGNHKIRKGTGPNKTASTFAGNGIAGYGGDGGAAIEAQLNAPTGITIDTGGNILFSDSLNHRVRRINPINTKIATFAGNGVQGYSGDYGSAQAAQLNTPMGLFSTPQSDLFVVDAQNHRVRRVSLSGTITTAAGNGVAGYTGDEGSATNGSLDTPMGAILDSVGNLIIVDSGNHAVRGVIW